MCRSASRASLLARTAALCLRACGLIQPVAIRPSSESTGTAAAAARSHRLLVSAPSGCCPSSPGPSSSAGSAAPRRAASPSIGPPGSLAPVLAVLAPLVRW